MNSSIKYSIIVPVFNVDRYLDDCIKSIVNACEKYSEMIELLLVNDGSTDNSLNICKRWEQEYKYIRVMSKDNEGLLLTRRYSLKQAKGEWIVFVDADDTIEDNYFYVIDTYISKHPKADMIIFATNTVDDIGNFISADKDVFEDNTEFRTKEEKERLFHEMAKGCRINPIWLKVVKKDVYDMEKDYSVYGKIKGEDVVQSIPILDRAQCIIFCNHLLYNYRLSSTGLGRNLKLKYASDYTCVYGLLYQYIVTQYPGSNEIIKDFYCMYLNYLVLLMRAFPKFLSLNEFLEARDIIFQDSIMKKCIASKAEESFGIKVQRVCEQHFPRLSYFIIKQVNAIRNK